jgi:hypothetical protein
MLPTSVQSLTTMQAIRSQAVAAAKTFILSLPPFSAYLSWDPIPLRRRRRLRPDTKIVAAATTATTDRGRSSTRRSTPPGWTGRTRSLSSFLLTTSVPRRQFPPWKERRELRMDSSTKRDTFYGMVRTKNSIDPSRTYK